MYLSGEIEKRVSRIRASWPLNHTNSDVDAVVFTGHKLIDAIYVKELSAQWCLDNLTIPQLVSEFGELFTKTS